MVCLGIGIDSLSRCGLSYGGTVVALAKAAALGLVDLFIYLSFLHITDHIRRIACVLELGFSAPFITGHWQPLNFKPSISYVGTCNNRVWCAREAYNGTVILRNVCEWNAFYIQQLSNTA